MKITRKGRWTVKKAGATVSQHDELTEAFESAGNAGGLCTVEPPVFEVESAAEAPAPVPAPPAPVPAPPAPVPAPPAPTPTPPAPPPATTLRALSADPIAVIPRPALGEAYVDPAYGTTVRRVSDAVVQYGGTAARHFYSRKPAINADGTKLLIWVRGGIHRGAWFVHSLSGETLAQVQGAAGNCEAMWHHADPRLIIHTANNGGLVWHTFNVETGQTSVLFDLRGRLPWADATRAWTKGEGCFSADGSRIALMAETDAFAMRGIVVVDLVTDVIRTRSMNERPDHISISPSGAWAVPSSAAGAGTVAMRCEDLAYSRVLHQRSEHSDLCIGDGGRDAYVFANYDTGWLESKDIESGAVLQLTPVYPRSGAGYALHVSGKAFDRPGWAVVSTYADFGNYSDYPDAVLEPQHRKVFLAELKAGGRLLNVAHTRVGDDGYYGGPTGEDAYFGEHQAVPIRDLSKIVMASNFGVGTVVDAYVIDVPAF